jgi:hypothetical protein
MIGKHERDLHLHHRPVISKASNENKRSAKTSVICTCKKQIQIMIERSERFCAYLRAATAASMPRIMMPTPFDGSCCDFETPSPPPVPLLPSAAAAAAAAVADAASFLLCVSSSASAISDYCLFCECGCQS